MSLHPIRRRQFLALPTAAAVTTILPYRRVAASPTVGGKLETFQQRRDWILETVLHDPDSWIRANRMQDNPFFAASACFKRGREELGQRLAREGYAVWTNNPKPNWDARAMENRGNRRVVDFFRLWPAMDCFVRHKQQLDSESKEAFRKMMTALNFYAYSTTANLNMMMWTVRHLGEQEWGAEAFVPLVRDTTSHYKSNPDIPFRDRLIQQMEGIARTGGPEYASRPYGTANIAPLLTLAELSHDPEVRSRARLAHESVLARYAPVWLRGSLILTSGRSYPDWFNDPVGFSSYLWVFFGGDLLSADQDLTPDTPAFNTIAPCLDAAVLGEETPDILQRIASERRAPYEVRNRFEERSAGRQISWVDPDFGLFSESFHTRPRPFSQTYPCGVRWIVPGAVSPTFLWLTVPVLDDADKARISHPHGFDLSAQSTFQHRGSLLFLVNTRPGGKEVACPYALCALPGGSLATLDEAASTGRIFLHYPGVLIAILASQTFLWDRQSGIRMRNSSLPIAAGESEIRIQGKEFVMALETAPARDYPDANAEGRLARFAEDVRKRSRIEMNTGTDSTGLLGRHTARDGTVIERRFAGPAFINGKPVDFDNWPVAESPWIVQKEQKAFLVAQIGGSSRTYNFDEWKIEDRKS